MSDYVVKVTRTGGTYTALLESPGGEDVLSNCSYGDIIQLLHQAIKEDAAPYILWVRTEVKQESGALPLEQWLVDLIQQDPEAAIEATSPAPVTIDLRESDTRPQELAGSILRTGHDVIADAFGDWVYISRAEDGKAECPICGRWHAVLAALSNGQFNCVVIECVDGKPGACVQLLLEHVAQNWYRIETYHLLRRPQPRFFINRRWGWLMGGPWVSMEQLAVKYEKFKKERTDVHTN